MPEPTQFTIGTEVSCTDGPCGAVNQGGRESRRGHGSPTWWSSRNTEPGSVGWFLSTWSLHQPAKSVSAVRQPSSNCSRSPKEIQFLPGTGYAGYPADQTMSMPYYANREHHRPRQHHTGCDTIHVSSGEVAVRRGEQVHAVDGEIGQVQGLAIAPHNHHVTHVLLQQGHLWGRKEVAIPIGACAGSMTASASPSPSRKWEDLPSVIRYSTEIHLTPYNGV